MYQPVPVTCLKAGEYTKAQLQNILNISPASVERYRQKFSLPDKEGRGKAKLIVVSEEAANAINEYLSTWQESEEQEKVSKSAGNGLSDNDLNNIRNTSDLMERVHELELKKVQLEGELKEHKALFELQEKAHLSILDAKNSEIETLKQTTQTLASSLENMKIALAVLERDNTKMLDQLHPPINMITTQKPRTLWQKIKFVFERLPD